MPLLLCVRGAVDFLVGEISGLRIVESICLVLVQVGVLMRSCGL